ncbi:MAG: hypothetical protein ACLPSW_07065 [Roseiarcus sp.]
MSGGGGGSSRPDPVTPVAPRKGGDGSGGAGGGFDPCVLTEETTLNSPVPAVVGGLKPGDVLAVNLEQGPPLRVVLQTPAGLVAGSITGAKLPQIIACLGAGVSYKAEVVSVKAAAVRVRVSNI